MRVGRLFLPFESSFLFARLGPDNFSVFVLKFRRFFSPAFSQIGFAEELGTLVGALIHIGAPPRTWALGVMPEIAAETARI